MKLFTKLGLVALSSNLFATNIVYVHGLNSNSNTFWTMAKSVAQAKGETKVLKVGYEAKILDNQQCYDTDNNLISCNDDKFKSDNTLRRIYGLQSNQFETKNLYYKNLNLTDTNLTIPSTNIITDNLKIDTHNILINLSNGKNLSFEAQGKELGVMLNRLKDITNDKDFILIGHSMGGIAIREYMQNNFDNNITVDGIITIGTPNNGVTTKDSLGIAGTSGKNLMVDSEDMTNLNSLNLDVYKKIPFIPFRISGHDGNIFSGDIVSGSDDDGVVAGSSQVPINEINTKVINFKPSCSDTESNCISTGSAIYHTDETKNNLIISEVEKFISNQIEVHQGWNLVSGNFKEFNLQPIKLAWKYNDNNWTAYSNNDTINKNLANDNYKTFNDIEDNKGIWIYSDENRKLLDIDNNTIINYQYQNNWNLVGTNKDINVSDIKCVNNNSNFTIWQYKNNNWKLYSQSQKDFNTIEKNSGYWINCSN